MPFAGAVAAMASVIQREEGMGTTTLESKTNFFRGAAIASYVWHMPKLCTAAEALSFGTQGTEHARHAEFKTVIQKSSAQH